MGDKVLKILILVVLVSTGYRFVLTPIYQLGDAKIYNAALDFRLGRMVKRAIVVQYPEAESWTVSLEADRPGRRYYIRSPGIARLYGPKIDGQYDLRMKCRYRSEWASGILRLWPEEVFVGACEKL